jgi:hypothetical protein
MGTDTMKSTYEVRNYLKAARDVDYPGSYTEVNREGMVKIYSQRQNCGQDDSLSCSQYLTGCSPVFIKRRGNEGNTT